MVIVSWKLLVDQCDKGVSFIKMYFIFEYICVPVGGCSWVGGGIPSSWNWTYMWVWNQITSSRGAELMETLTCLSWFEFVDIWYFVQNSYFFSMFYYFKLFILC